MTKNMMSSSVLAAVLLLATPMSVNAFLSNSTTLPCSAIVPLPGPGICPPAGSGGNSGGGAPPGLTGGDPLTSGIPWLGLGPTGTGADCIALLVHPDILAVPDEECFEALNNTGYVLGNTGGSWWALDNAEFQLGTTNVFGLDTIETVVGTAIDAQTGIVRLATDSSTEPVIFNTDFGEPEDGDSLRLVGIDSDQNTFQQVDLTFSNECPDDLEELCITLPDKACGNSLLMDPQATTLFGIAGSSDDADCTTPDEVEFLSAPFGQLFVGLFICLSSNDPPETCQVTPVTEADENEYPFYGITGNETAFCGGILVHEDVVLTRADCIVELGLFNEGDLFYLGANDLLLKNNSETLIVQADSATDGTYALVQVNSTTVTPANRGDAPGVGGEAKVIGFASEDYAEPFLSLVEQESSIALDCSDLDPEVSFVCLQRIGDLCVGDAGAPILDGSNTVIGLYSGDEGCNKDTPIDPENSPEPNLHFALDNQWITDFICYVTAPENIPVYCANYPSAAPSPAPSAEPSPAPSESPSAEPSPSPSAAPSPEPSESPSAEPSPSPSAEPSAEPSVSSAPSAEPSAQPSSAPSPSPSAQPSPLPSVAPSAAPSASPSVAPSSTPSKTPTIQPNPPGSCADRFDCDGIFSNGSKMNIDFLNVVCYDICASLLPSLFLGVGFRCGECD